MGENDMKLALKLTRAGSDHAKFLRQIFINMDITAPLRWWKEFDTYKVGTVANSTSTMHKLGSRNLTRDDFSWDKLTAWRVEYLNHINDLIDTWQKDKSEENFRVMIDDLLDSFNQTRTVTFSYETARAMFFARKNHKQREWRDFTVFLANLPYGELIITERVKLKQ